MLVRSTELKMPATNTVLTSLREGARYRVIFVDFVEN